MLMEQFTKEETVGEITIRVLPLNPLFTRVKFHCLPHNPRVVCPTTFNQSCPICEKASKIWNEINDISNWESHQELSLDAKKKAQSLKPYERYYYNIIADNDEQVRLYIVGKTLHTQIINGIANIIPKLSFWEKCWQWFFPKSWNVLDWDSGYDFVVRKELRRFNYSIFSDYNKSSFTQVKKPAGTKKQIEMWKKHTPFTAKDISAMSYEELKVCMRKTQNV